MLRAPASRRGTRNKGSYYWTSVYRLCNGNFNSFETGEKKLFNFIIDRNNGLEIAISFSLGNFVLVMEYMYKNVIRKG
jgi:hypothetical protein